MTTHLVMTRTQIEYMCVLAGFFFPFCSIQGPNLCNSEACIQDGVALSPQCPLETQKVSFTNFCTFQPNQRGIKIECH